MIRTWIVYLNFYNKMYIDHFHYLIQNENKFEKYDIDSALLGNKSSEKAKNDSHQCSTSCNDKEFENCTENVRCIH